MQVANLIIKVTNEGLDAAKKGLDGLGKTAKTAAERAEEAAKKFEGMKETVDGFNKNVSGLRNAAAVGMGALTGTLYKSISVAQKFESAMSEVKKTVDFESPQGIEDMRKGLENLSTEIPQTFEELATIASNAGLLGVAEENILGFTETIAKMGVAFDLESGAVAESMAKIANVFQIPIENIGELGDVINYLSNNMASTAGDIIDFTKRTAAMATTMGLSEASTAAFGSAMVALGSTPEVAGTAFNGLMGKLANLDGWNKKSKKAFREMGLDAAEFGQLMANDAEAGILTFLEALREVPQEARAAFAYDMLGEGLAPKILPMAEGFNVLTEALNMTADAAGSMEAEFQAISDTSANKMVLFKNNIDLVWAAIGDAFIPALNDALDTIRPFLNSLADWARENPELVKTIAIVSGVVMGSVLLLTGLGLAISGIISVFTGLAAVGGALSVVFGALSLPVLGVVAAVAAVVAIGVLLYKNWDTIKEKAAELGEYLGEVWENIKEVVSEKFEQVSEYISSRLEILSEVFSNIWQGIKDKAKEIFDGLPEPVHGAIDRIMEAFNAFQKLREIITEYIKAAIDVAVSWLNDLSEKIVNKFNEVWEGIKTEFNKFLDWFGEKWDSAVEIVVGIMGKIGDALVAGFNIVVDIVMTRMSIMLTIAKAAFQSFLAVFEFGLSVAATIFNTGFDLIKVAIQTAFKAIVALVKGDFQGFVNAIKEGMGQAGKIMENGASEILGAVKNLGVKLFKIGSEAIQGFINGLKSKGAALRSAAAGVGRDAWQATKNFLIIRSPSRLMAEVGKDFVGGLAVGISNNAKDAAKAAKDAAQKAVEAVKGELRDLIKEIDTFGSDNPYAGYWWDFENTDKYIGVTKKQFQVLIDTLAMRDKLVKQEEERVKKLDNINAAAERAEEAILDMRRSMELGSNSTNLEQLVWDLKNTTKYAHLAVEARERLMKQTRDYDKYLAEQERYNDLKNELGNLEEALFYETDNRSSIDVLKDEYAERLKLLEDSLENELLTKQRYHEMEQQAEQVYQDAMRDLKLEEYNNNLMFATGIGEALLGENKRAKRALFAIEKGFTLAMVLLKNKEALANAWALPYPTNIGAVAKVIAQSAELSSAVQGIFPKGFKQGGYTGSIGRNKVAGVVHGQEYVFDAQSTKAIGVNNLERIRQGKGVGETNNVNISISVNANGQANVSEQQADKMSRNMANAVKAVVIDTLRREKRQGGALYA